MDRSAQLLCTCSAMAAAPRTHQEARKSGEVYNLNMYKGSYSSVAPRHRSLTARVGSRVGPLWDSTRNLIMIISTTLGGCTLSLRSTCCRRAGAEAVLPLTVGAKQLGCAATEGGDPPPRGVHRAPAGQHLCRGPPRGGVHVAHPASCDHWHVYCRLRCARSLRRPNPRPRLHHRPSRISGSGSCSAAHMAWRAKIAALGARETLDLSRECLACCRA